MRFWPTGCLAIVALIVAAELSASVPEDRVLRNDLMSITVQRDRAIISDLHREGGAGDWLSSQAGDASGLFAHFLCFDRWGPVTLEEEARGIPFHGEAAQVPWKWKSAEANAATLEVTLPVSGLQAARAVRISQSAAVFSISNTFRNPTSIERVYNAIEHPTLSEQGLSAETRISTNAIRGFLQRNGKVVPDSTFDWPHARYSGDTWDFRDLVPIDGRVMAALVFPSDAEWGWVCMENRSTGEILGYVWPLADYPWLILWAATHEGRVMTRSIELGTTGLHRPMPELQETAKLLDRPLFHRLQPGEQRTHQLWGFLIKLPRGGSQIEKVRVDKRSVLIEVDGGRSTYHLPVL